MRQLYFFWIACLCISARSHAQTIEVNRPFPFEQSPLKTLVPNKQQMRKAYIIDLFSSGCVVCFESLPKLKSMQVKYQNQMQFLLIGMLDSKIEKAYRQFESFYDLKFPVAYDSNFYKRTGRPGLPAYIWIDSSGIVKAITGGEELTDANIKIFLKNRTVESLKAKASFDPNRLYLQNGNGGNDSNFLFRSVLIPWKEGQPGYHGSNIADNDKPFQILGIRADQLYRIAYAGKPNWDESDPLYGNFYPYPIFSEDNRELKGEASLRYSYSVFFGNVDVKRNLMKIMQEDLNRSLPYEAHLEERLMPYLKLVLINGDTLSVSSSAVCSGTATHGGLDIKGFPIKSMMQTLHKYYPFVPVFVNETGIKGSIDIKIDAVMGNIESLRKGLQSAGFDLIESKKIMKVVVLKKR